MVVKKKRNYCARCQHEENPGKPPLRCGSCGRVWEGMKRGSAKPVSKTESEAAKKAIETIKLLTQDAELGKIYKGKIKKIMDFGAFCEVLPGREGLIHVSELADKYVKKVGDVVKVGQEVRVKVIEIDPQGKLSLSMKKAKETE